MASNTGVKPNQPTKQVSKVELNSWRRGFTPQAELWNGRMAMIGLALSLGVLISFRLLF